MNRINRIKKKLRRGDVLMSSFNPVHPVYPFGHGTWINRMNRMERKLRQYAPEFS
jgi:hypothetical protein